jgi:hypothetical protein
MKEEEGQFCLSEVIIFTLFLYLLYFFFRFYLTTQINVNLLHLHVTFACTQQTKF